MRFRVLVVVLAALIFIGLVLLMFWPQPIEGTPVGSYLANSLASYFDPSGDGRQVTIRALEQWMNFIVFIPFAAFLFFVFKRGALLWSLIISISMSLIAELSQLLLLPARVSSLEDFVLNSSGALVGASLAWLISQLYKHRQG